MTGVAEAEALITAHMPRRPVEQLPIQAAVGRILAEPIRAERDQPPFDRVTMDGIAIASSAWAKGRRAFGIEAVQAAGVAARRLGSPDGCVRVMTGAMRPQGTDAVIPIERVRIEEGVAHIDASARVASGQFIHAQGSDRRRNDVVLQPGTVIGPAETAVLASSGCVAVAVSSLPRIGIVSTGDELVPVAASEIAPFQIRSSNDLAIAASVQRAGVGQCERRLLPDDPERILSEVAVLHEHNDILILSGGVSMGDFDFVPAVLETLGSELVFHRITQKPGRPMWFGISGAGKPIFALPGNPVSTLLCMTRYVVPALRSALGLKPPEAELARLMSPVTGPADFTYFVPVVLHWDQAGWVQAEPRPTNTSGDFASLAATDGFIELTAGRAEHAVGETGRIYRW
jgi:molybdopterin molybdotransferase